MAEKTKITFVVPENLQQDLREHMIKDGYSLREKSRWVTEAIQSLLALPNFIEFISYSNEMRGFEKVETITILKELKRQLDENILEIRKLHPIMEGVQSRIVRTAIVQRILRS